MSVVPLPPPTSGTRPARHRLLRARLPGALSAAGALAATLYCLCWLWFKPEQTLSRFHFRPAAQWLTTQCDDQPTGCFRLDLDLPGTVSNAYLTVAATGGFEVTANGMACGQFFRWGSTRPFQTGLSEAGQKLYPDGPAIALNFPREYQWSDHDNAALPVWIDVRPYLKAGRNALCVEVESSGLAPAFILQGEIELATGERIWIHSDERWRAEPVPPTPPQDAWTRPDQSARDWHCARPLGWHRPAWRAVSPGIYQAPFTGERLRLSPEENVTWFRQNLMLDQPPKEAFIRLASDQPFQIFVNGRRLQVPNEGDPELSTGPWFVYDREHPTSDVVPERLDTDAVGSLLPGRRYDTEPHAEPALGGFGPGREPLNSSTNDYRDGAGQRAAASQPAVPGRAADNGAGGLDQPTPGVLPPLTRDRRALAFVAYRLEALLQPGPNEIRIGVYGERPALYARSWTPLLAFDGAAIDAGGRTQRFGTDGFTECAVANGVQGPRGWTRAVSDGPIRPELLPGLTYLGWAAGPPSLTVSAGLGFVLLAVAFLWVSYRRPRWGRRLRRLASLSGAVTASLAALLVLRAALLERSEIIFWRLPWTPLAVLAFAWALGLLVQWWARRRPRPRGAGSQREQAGLTNREWPTAFACALGLCFFLRAWQIDYQPPGDDEYASIQASLAIAQKGVPEIANHVWYTRSPFYHYLAGAVVKLTNGGLYSLRLLSVAFACASCALLGRWARELTGQRFLAFSAMLLYALHPYLVFTGHIARFYQQQQFFELATIYCFTRGFVQGASMRLRYLAVASFLAAALSQEISLLQLVPLCLCYALFAQRLRWADEARLTVAGGCALALIALDLLFAQVRCLTALDGVSPNVEATLAWTFHAPTNFFSLLIGYSRLHLFLSVFLVGGALLTWARKELTLPCLYLYLAVSVCMANLLITSPGFRYQYAFLPLWLLLSIYGVGKLTPRWWPRARAAGGGAAFAAIMLALAALSFSPWRLLPSYQSPVIGDSTRALRFVAEHRRAGDRVVITEPHPHAALLETGSADYDLRIPILYDFVMRHDGLLVDRNAGAKVIGKTAELQRAFAENDRLWIVINREKMRSRGANLAWDYPGARAELYVRKNARLAFRSYLWSVYLWDVNAGHYSPFRENARNWAE